MAYGNTSKDGLGTFYHLLVDTLGRLLVHDGWDNLMEVDADANDSDKTFTVPANKVWKVAGIMIVYVSTATAGNRQLAVEFADDSANVIFRMRLGTTQAASLTRYYQLGIGLPDLTSFRDTDFLYCPLPSDIVLPEDYTIRVYDKAAVDAAADDMSIYMSILQKSG